MTDLIELAKQQAAEIACAGHNGWGNTMLELAAALEAAREESDRWRDRYRSAIDQARGKGGCGEGWKVARAPRVGNTVHHPYFGGGATARVVRILPMTGRRGMRVHVHLTRDDGGPIKNRGRVWSLATWRDFVESAAEVRPAPPEVRMTDPAIQPCPFPTGKHFWSIPEASGRQTCLWCPAVKWPEPIDGEPSPTPPDPGHERG